jgi:hypothetical protein
MIELVLAVCLIDDPSRCKDVRQTFMEEGVTPMACMMIGQHEAVKWLEGHPKWQLKRWSCQPAGRIAKI